MAAPSPTLPSFFVRHAGPSPCCSRGRVLLQWPLTLPSSLLRPICLQGYSFRVWLNIFTSVLQLRLRLHERGFISIRFHDFKTAPKLMRFGSVYTEPFSYSLRHAEVITDQRDPSKKESTILFFSSWRNVDL